MLNRFKQFQLSRESKNWFMMKTAGATTHLKLPFQFDEKRLIKDLEIAAQKHWVPHFNKGGYEGEWNSIALFAKDGDEKNIQAFNPDDQSSLQPTPLMKDCTYFQEVLDQFKCEFASVRLLKLQVGAVIKPHKDFECGYENDIFRLHIPIVTSKEVAFVLDGQRLEMQVGECWYTNVNYIHSVANHGHIDRVHLVFDGIRNEWSDQLFFSLAPKESFFPTKKENYDAATIKKIIAELEQTPGEGAKDLIQQFKTQLKGIE